MRLVLIIVLAFQLLCQSQSLASKVIMPDDSLCIVHIGDTVSIASLSNLSHMHKGERGQIRSLTPPRDPEQAVMYERLQELGFFARRRIAGDSDRVPRRRPHRRAHRQHHLCPAPP